MFLCSLQHHLSSYKHGKRNNEPQSCIKMITSSLVSETQISCLQFQMDTFDIGGRAVNETSVTKLRHHHFKIKINKNEQIKKWLKNIAVSTRVGGGELK